MGDYSAALLQQIEADLRGQGVTGELTGNVLVVDVAGTPHEVRVRVAAPADPEPAVG